MKAGFVVNKKCSTYPIQLHIKDQPCTVIGGGKVALRKVKRLLQAGAIITLIAPVLNTEILTLAKEGKITLLRREFLPGDTKGAFLIIAATNNSSVNEAIASEASSHKQLVNVINSPNLGNFIVPGTIQNGNLIFTVTTGGTPALTKLITRELRDSYGDNFAAFADFLLEMRNNIKTIPSTPLEREKLWQEMLTPKIMQLVRTGNIEQAKESITNAINCFRPKP
jgi:precorrin-2 dehydrogenase / sirohydrochlorin ferrochelatase